MVADPSEASHRSGPRKTGGVGEPSLHCMANRVAPGTSWGSRMAGSISNSVRCAAVAVAIAPPSPAAAPPRGLTDKVADARRVSRLIEQLGSEQFAEREKASQALDALGEPAMAALTQAAAESADAEVRQRARRLIGV